jgi:putative PIN family toxin of toxin-antitoxin system
MQKVVIDTNVIVSALIQKSYPFFIINDLVLNDLIDVCISEEVMEEYFAVLHRKKFLKYPEFVVNAEAFLIAIEYWAAKFKPKNRLTILKDPGDNKFLELSKECHADFLITGNTNDFTMRKFGKTKIVNPKEFWERFS